MLVQHTETCRLQVVIISVPSYHLSVVLVGEVKRWQDGLELVENLIVSRHVSGQNASAITT